MKFLYKEFLDRIRAAMAQKVEIKPQETEVLKDIENDELVIKSLYENDLIDEDEYLTKLQTLVKYKNEIFKAETAHQEWADAIIFNDKNEILLLRRNSQESFMPGFWGLPGGKIEEDEEPSTAAIRELLEETNIVAVDPVLFLEKKVSGGKIHYFTCTASNIDQIILDNNEHYSFEWTSKEKRKELALLPDLEETLSNISQYKLAKSQFDQDLITEDEFLTEIVKSGVRGQRKGIRHKKEGVHEFDYYISNAANKLNSPDITSFRKNLDIEIKRITKNKYGVRDLTDQQVKRYFDFSKNSNGKPFYK